MYVYHFKYVRTNSREIDAFDASVLYRVVYRAESTNYTEEKNVEYLFARDGI
jgi:hypothetical protein